MFIDRGLSVLGSFPEARDRQLGIGSNVGRCMDVQDGHHRILGMTITLSDASEVVSCNKVPVLEGLGRCP